MQRALLALSYMVPALRGIAGPPCVPALFIFGHRSVLLSFLLPVPLFGRKALADLLDSMV